MKTNIDLPGIFFLLWTLQIMLLALVLGEINVLTLILNEELPFSRLF